MKKVIALLLVSALVSVATFAQVVTTTTVAAPPAPELVISGLVETGLKYQSAKIGDAGKLFLYDEDDAEEGILADVNFNYDAPLFGVAVTVEGVATATEAAPISASIATALAYLNLFDKAAVIKVGLFTDETIMTPGYEGFLDLDAEYGASLVITPTTGLNLFYGVRVTPFASPDKDVLGEFIVGAKLSLDKLFDVTVGYDQQYDMNASYIGAGFNLTAVEGFSFAAEAAIPVLVDVSPIWINEVIGVTIDKLGFGLIANQFLKNGASPADATFDFEPSVSYDLGAVVLSLAYGFTTASHGLWAFHPKAVFPVAEGATVVSGVKIGTLVAGTASDSVGLIVYSSFQFSF